MNPGPVPEIPSTGDERTWAMITHLSGICCGFVVGLILWILKKDTSPFVNDQGKEAVNYQITFCITLFVVAIAMAVFRIVLAIVHLGLIGSLISTLVFGAVFLGNLVLCIMAGMKANTGGVYRYPVALRLIK